MKYVFAITLALLATSLRAADQTDVDLLEQAAWREAVEAVADSVVQIHTVGGLNRVGKTFVGQGPTTGLVVSADGYIVSSAFHFAGEPTSILVRLATGRQLPAELVARDKNRMLVLLKVASDSPLPVVDAVASDQMHVGQWAVALGRTFRSDHVGVSVGIVSGLNRMYGRVIQTDASISVANYGGPLVDIHGRVLGVLVPMAPQAGGAEADSEVAGAEYYDSGIGFAVPLEHVYSILDRWKRGDDLLPGKLGVGLASGEAHLTPPKITAVWPASPASKAAWQPQDVIVAIDGKPIETRAQLRFLIMPRYAGEILNIAILRGDEKIETQITLAGELPAYRHAFLGVLPEREKEPQEKAGVVVRSVWPDSPAADAGVQAGDRLLRIASADLNSIDDAIDAMDSLHPKQKVELVLQRGEEKKTLTTLAAALPEDILPRSNLPNNEDSPNGNTEDQELEPFKLPEFAQEARFLLPTGKSNRSPGLLVWLGDASEQHDQELADAWRAVCLRDNLILLIAHPADQAGWSSEDLPYLARLLRASRARWEIPGRRTVIGGQGKAGQLAYALAFRRRGSLGGAIGIDSPLPRTLRIPENRPGSRFATLAVETRHSTFSPLVRRDQERLREAGYPASWFERTATNNVPNNVSGVLDATTRDAIARWIDGLDRF